MPWETDKNAAASKIRPIDSAKKKQLNDALELIYNRQSRESDLKIDRRDLSEPISFRLSVTQLRLIDELIAGRDDPLIKTRTDLFRLSIGMFLDAFKAARKGGGVQLSPLYTEFELERVKARVEADNRFIENIEQMIRTADISARKSIKELLDERIEMLGVDPDMNKDRLEKLNSVRRIYYGE